MICDEVRRMLGAYVDKELELTRQSDLEKHLAGCPSCQAAAEEIACRELRDALPDYITSRTAYLFPSERFRSAFGINSANI